MCIIVGGAMADGPSVIECQLRGLSVRYNVRVLRLKGLVLFCELRGIEHPLYFMTNMLKYLYIDFTRSKPFFQKSSV